MLVQGIIVHGEVVSGSCSESFSFPLHDGFPVQVTGRLTTSVTVGEKSDDHSMVLSFNVGAKSYLLNAKGVNCNAAWPKSGGYYTTAIGDIENDGQNEILCAGADINLSVWENDGSFSSGWPYEFVNGYARDSLVMMDLNGDKKQEVIVGFGYSTDYLTILDSEGSDLPGYPVVLEDTFFYHPGIADLDSNGVYEIIVGFHGWSHKKVIAYDLGGNVFQGNWIVNLEDLGLGGLRSDITIADIDGDNRPEILFGSDESDTAPYDYHAVVINNDKSFATGWPKIVQTRIYGGLSVGDIDCDEKLEVAGVTAGDYDELDNFFSRLYVWNGEDGTDVPGWPQDIMWLACVGQNVIIGDLDGDCIPELLVAGEDNFQYLTQVWAYHNDGTVVEGFPLTIDGFLIEWSNSCFIADIDNDGLVEIGIGVSNSNTNISRIYVWDLPFKYRKDCQDWPQYRHDAQHTGNYHYPKGLPILPQVPTLSSLSLLILLVLLGCGILLSVGKTSSGEARNDHTNND